MQPNIYQCGQEPEDLRNHPYPTLQTCSMSTIGYPLNQSYLCIDYLSLVDDKEVDKLPYHNSFSICLVILLLLFTTRKINLILLLLTQLSLPLEYTAPCQSLYNCASRNY